MATPSTTASSPPPLSVTAMSRWKTVGLFHMLLSVVLVAELLSSVGELSDQLKAAILRIKQLEVRADHDLYQKLLHRCSEMQPASR